MIPGFATPEGTASFARGSGADPANYREFAGLTLSNVGMGTYLGGADAATDEAVCAAVKASVGAGINVVDTAINYRGQRAERSVGRAVSELAKEGTPRDQIFISTKNGYVTNDAEMDLDFWGYVKQEYADRGIVSEGDITPGYHCMTVPYLSDQLGRSLRNLGLECVDLVYLHNSAEGQLGHVPREKYVAMLKDAFGMYERERREGRIRFYGMATWDCLREPPGSAKHVSLEEAVAIARDVGGESHGFRFVQLPFNMYYDQAMLARTQQVNGEDVPALEAAERLGVGVFTSVPFMQGRLLQPGVMPEFGDMAPAARALQFIRSAPGVIAPLAGQKDPGHVRENAAVMKVPPMSGKDVSELVKKLTG